MMALKIPDTITEAELFEVIGEARKRSHRTAYLLGFYACMRVSEVVKLQPADVQWTTKLLHIRQAKGAKDRMIPFSPKIEKPLRQGLPVGIGARALQIAFKSHAQKALGKDLHFHTLRHSGITHYIVKERWSSLEVQRLAGHSRIQTTELYTHVNPADLVARMWEK
jgi:integrase/recombinase XerD